MRLIPVILAGEPANGPFANLQTPKLQLPISPVETMLDMQLGLAKRISPEETCLVLVGDENAARKFAIESYPPGEFEIRTDRSPHRGTAGVLKDCLAAECAIEDDVRFVVLEASVLPEFDFSEIPEFFSEGQFDVGLGLDSHGYLAGVTVLTKRVLELVPSVGYFDLKEQLTAAVVAEGFRLEAFKVVDESQKLRDLSDFIRQLQGRNGSEDGQLWHWARERSIIARTAVVEEAKIFDSIILDGAKISPGAVVARSIIGRDVSIGRGMMVVDSVVGRDPAQTFFQLQVEGAGGTRKLWR